jgi:phosphoribosylformylglycinamidine cyclo-ligase
MAPTRIYVKPVLELIKAIPVHGIAHITGGGLVDNIPRVIPVGLEVALESGSWPRDPVFQWLQENGNVDPSEMFRVFNCGIGMTIQVAAADAARAVEVLRINAQPAHVIGEVRNGDHGVVIA